MKMLILAMLVLVQGCALKLGGERGLVIQGPKPPKDAYIRITGRSIGINVGQNPATQSPEMTLGYKSVTYDRLPTSVGTNIFIPEVRATIGATAGGGVQESLETGKATK